MTSQTRTPGKRAVCPPAKRAWLAANRAAAKQEAVLSDLKWRELIAITDHDGSIAADRQVASLGILIEEAQIRYALLEDDQMDTRAVWISAGGML